MSAQPRASDPIIVVEGLSKQYGDRRAVDGLSFSVGRGETFALLGPNGAGKTTTVEILEGFRRADTGTVRVLGFDPAHGEASFKARIGVMLQEGGLPPAMTPLEALRAFARFYPAPADPSELLGRVGLAESADVRFRRLSGGQKQRLALALALLPQPDLVFLDEPTAGMDPTARRATWEIVAGLRRAGVSTLLTTHYLDEAERLADRVAIVDHGRLVALGTPAELMREGSETIRLHLAADLGPDLLHALTAVAEARQIEPGRYLVTAHDTPEALVQIATELQQQGVGLLEMRVGRASLEEVFMRLTGAEEGA